MLVERLYSHMLEDWHKAAGLLDREEYAEYERCRRSREEQQAQLSSRLKEGDRELFACCLANSEQVEDTECRLCFARGLAIGLGLAGFAAGE